MPFTPANTQEKKTKNNHANGHMTAHKTHSSYRIFHTRLDRMRVNSDSASLPGRQRGSEGSPNRKPPTSPAARHLPV